MDDLACWLVQDLVTSFPNFKRQVCVLVIRGCVARVESAHTMEQSVWNGERCGRAIINFAQIIIFGSFWIIEFAVVPSRCISPNDPAGFLQATVRIDKF